jgi:predicted transposase YbfD/YdcC
MNTSLIEILSSVADARRGQAKQYHLANIMLFCIFGLLTGATSYKTLCSFIDERFDMLQAAYPSSMKRAPSPSTLWRILGLVNLVDLEAAFRRHAGQMNLALGGGSGGTVAYDGKAMKGSYDKAAGKKGSQLLRAFASGTQIILGHIAIMAKSNEIPAMQALVRDLGLAGAVSTADAMHCQVKTIAAAKESGGEALLQVKGNQKCLKKACEALPENARPEKTHVETGKIARGRQETRRVEVFKAGSLLDAPEWQGLVPEAVRVTRTVMHRDSARGWKWRSSHEVAWYVSTQTGKDAVYYGGSVRGHWGIENRVHHVLDVAMREDASRVRKSATAFSILRSFVLNILRFNRIRNVADCLYRNCTTFERVLAFGGT